MISWNYALRELQRRPGRSLLSLLSVIIAVAAIVAVTSATATTRKSYRQVYEALSGRTDLEVVASGGGRFSQSYADALKKLPGVRAVVPVFHRATIIYAHSQEAKEKVKVLAFGIDAEQGESWAGFHLTAGRLPTAADEVAIEAELSTSLKLAVGDQIRMLTARGLRPRKVVGLVALENASRLQQGGMVLAPLKSLQQTFKSPGEVDALHLYLDKQDLAPAVIAAASQKLPSELHVRIPSAERAGRGNAGAHAS